MEKDEDNEYAKEKPSSFIDLVIPPAVCLVSGVAENLGTVDEVPAAIVEDQIVVATIELGRKR